MLSFLTLKSDVKFGEKLVVSKMTGEIWQIITRALESLKIGTLMNRFDQSRKCMYRGVLCHGNKE